MNGMMNRRQALSRLRRPLWYGGKQQPLAQYQPRLAFRQNAAAPGDILVSIFLRGGLDGLSAVVPYAEGANYYDVRPHLAIPAPGAGTFSALDLDGQFGLHPSMARMKELYDSGLLAIVHATGLTDATRSHFDAQRFMEQGVPGDKTIGTGWIGRHLAVQAAAGDSNIRGLAINDHLPFALRGPAPALAVSSLDEIGFRGAKGSKDDEDLLLATLQQLYLAPTTQSLLRDQATLVFETVDTLQQLAQAGYTPAPGAVYPEDGFGFSMRQVAQLIKADLGLEAAAVDLGGWDTHETQGVDGGGYAELVASLAQGLHAFATDLGDGIGNVTLVVMSEFGRTVAENASRGTDHGHGNVMFVLGGGVAGGKVYTQWPGLAPGGLDEEGDLAITIDFRDVLAEIVSRRLLNPAVGDVFPNFVPTPLEIVAAKG